MQDLKLLERRIKNLSKTRQLTYTMRLVSSLKVHKLEQEVDFTKNFYRELLAFYRKLPDQGGDQTVLETAAASNEKPSLLVILAGNHGLAGAFQTNLRDALKADLAKGKADYEALCLGSKAESIAKSAGLGLKETWTFSEEPGPEADKLVNYWQTCKNDYRDLVFLSNRYYTAGKQTAEFTSLSSCLKQDLGSGDASRSFQQDDFFIEPRPEYWEAKLVKDLEYAFCQLLFCESLAGEYIQRMVAMTAATNNADDLLKKLEVSRQRSRQSQITQEILEIVGGSEI